MSLWAVRFYVIPTIDTCNFLLDFVHVLLKWISPTLEYSRKRQWMYTSPTFDGIDKGTTLVFSHIWRFKKIPISCFGDTKLSDDEDDDDKDGDNGLHSRHFAKQGFKTNQPITIITLAIELDGGCRIYYISVGVLPTALCVLYSTNNITLFIATRPVGLLSRWYHTPCHIISYLIFSIQTKQKIPDTA